MAIYFNGEKVRQINDTPLPSYPEKELIFNGVQVYKAQNIFNVKVYAYTGEPSEIEFSKYFAGIRVLVTCIDLSLPPNTIFFRCYAEASKGSETYDLHNSITLGEDLKEGDAYRLAKNISMYNSHPDSVNVSRIQIQCASWNQSVTAITNITKNFSGLSTTSADEVLLWEGNLALVMDEWNVE